MAPEIGGEPKAFLQAYFGLPAKHGLCLSGITIEDLNVERPTRNRIPHDLAAEARDRPHLVRKRPHGEPLAGTKIKHLAHAHLRLSKTDQVRIHVVVDVKQVALRSSI